MSSTVTTAKPATSPTKATDTRVMGLREQISVRKGLLGCGTAFTVALHGNGTVTHTGDNRWGQADCSAWTNLLSISCGPDFVVGLHEDGSVVAVGNNSHGQLDVDRWFCIRSVCCGLRHVGAITQNGHVLCVGDNTHGQCDTRNWKNIVDLCCGNHFTVGLTAQGTVVVAGGSASLRHTLSQWKQIVALFTDQPRRTVYAIDAGGRILSSRPLPPYTLSWRNVVYVASDGVAVYGITADGDMLSDYRRRTSKELAQKSDQVELGGVHDGWVACDIGHGFLVALRRDGRVIGVGNDDLGQIRTSDFDPRFPDYATYFSKRQTLYRHQEDVNRQYQVRMATANRFSQWLDCSERITAALHVSGRIMTTAKIRSVKGWGAVCRVRCGNAHLLCLHANGRVSAAGNDVNGCCQVSDWTDIRAIHAGRYHSFGLAMDGTVRFAGQNLSGQGDVDGWKSIKSIFGNEKFTIGLGWDGSLTATRIRSDAPDLSPEEIRHWNACLNEIQTSPLWQDIEQVAVSDHHVAALRRNGTVVTVGDLDYRMACGAVDGPLSIELPWPRVRSITAGSGYTVGLCYGGTVVAYGTNRQGQCDTGNWSQIVAVDCGYAHTVGLRADGHAVSCGMQQTGRVGLDSDEDNGYTPCQTATWQDIIAIRCGAHHTVAVSRSGHLYACGRYTDGQCDVSSMILFHDLDKVHKRDAQMNTSHAASPTATAATVQPSQRENEATMPGHIQQAAALDVLRADAESFRSRIAGSTGHVSVLTDEGRVQSLDLDSNTLLTDVAYGSPVCAISAGSHHTAMLTQNGHVRIRSSFKTGSLTMPVLDADTTETVVSMASGVSYTALLMTDGRVRLFSTGRPVPFSTDDWENITSISSGAWHVAGVDTAGNVRSAGTKNRSLDIAKDGVSPWDANGWTGVQSVVCSTDATLCIDPNGALRIAGYATSPTAHTDCDGWRNVVSVASSGQHVVALLDDGRVRATGSNQSGECDTDTWDQIIMIATRPGVTFGLRADGCVVTAGRCEFAAHRLRSIRALFSFGGTLVLLTAAGDVLIQRAGTRKEPWLVRSLSLFTPDTTRRNVLSRLNQDADPATLARSIRARLARGMAHAAYLDENDLVQTVGSNHYGQRQTHDWPAASAVSCGLYHTAALLKDGRIRMTGYQEGHDGTPDAFDAFLSGASDLSEDAASRSRFVAVSCGYHHTVAIRSDGQVFAVGDNRYGQCAVKKFQRAVDLSCGVRHTAVLLDDGQVRAVGDNRYGQCNTEAWTDVVMTACGEFHTVGLRRDGTVVATGSDANGQCRLSDLSDVISVACLAEATVCVKADGSVTIRGNHHIPDETVSRLREVLAVRTCEYRLMALCADGRILFHPQT